MEGNIIVIRIRINDDAGGVAGRFTIFANSGLVQGNSKDSVRLADAGPAPKAIPVAHDNGWQKMNGEAVRLANAATKRALGGHA